MRDNTFSKKVFIKTVSDNLKNKYRKTIDDATQQELYQACLLYTSPSPRD